MNETLLSGEVYLRALLDAFPSPVLIVDRNLQIHDFNRAAAEFMEEGADVVLRRLCGDLMHCIHARRAEGGCGTTEHCPDCILRQTAEAVADGASTFRRMSELQIERQDTVQRGWFLVSGSAFEFEDRNLVILTLEDITEVVELRRIIPICSHCRKVRDDQDYWQEVENYLHKSTNVRFSHGICPDCLKKHYQK